MPDDLLDRVAKGTTTATAGPDMLDRLAAPATATPQPNLITGEGMEAQAQQQARSQIAAPVIQRANEIAAKKQLLDIRMNRAMNSPTPMTNASMLYAPIPAAKALIGAKLGSAAGGYVAGQPGQLVGGLVGGIGGAAVGSSPAKYIGGKVYKVNPSTGQAELSSWAEALTHPSKIPEAVLKKISADVPLGPSELSASERVGLQQKAEDLMKRPDELSQAVKDRIASRIPMRVKPQIQAPPENFPGATSSAAPVGNAQLPPAGQVQQPNAQLVSQFKPPEPSRIVTPGSAPPSVKVTYQSYPREELYRMALKGDIQAGLELIRSPKGFSLPPNFKYLIEAEAKKVPWRNQ